MDYGMRGIKAMSNELETATELAVRAGDILLKYYRRSTSVEWKGAGDPVTLADKSASTFIIEALKRRFPQDGILCEEEKDDASRLTRSRAWIVDPMDGTKEFVANLGEFAVMIGLAIERKSVLGVVYQPTQQKLYYAEAGNGAYLKQGQVTRRLWVSLETDPSRMIIAVSRSHDSADAQRIRKALEIQQMIRSGSAGLKVGMICEGKAHLYFHIGPGTNQWDTCAPETILQEAGGRMTDVAGNRLVYNIPEPRHSHGITASNSVIHDRVVDVIKMVMAAK
jgi:3'(2'), 5'-bisphosphate nucleotidase